MHTDGLRFDLGSVVEAVLRRLAPRADAAGLRLSWSAGPQVALARRGDPARLQQVLTSLVGSALDGAGRGDVAVEVGAAGDGLLRFEVGGASSGAWNARAEGRLAVCRRLVTAMGGELGIGQGPGRDGVVWFTARLEPAADHGPAPAAAGTPAGGGAAATGPGERPRVLVADDSPVNQEVAKRTLERMGYDVGVTGDGAAALEAVATGGYAAVLMDCQMPGMDGYEATSALRRREGGQGRTPVIAMTASAMESDRERCLAAGMDDYVSKPFEYHVLQAVLARWIHPGAGAP